MIRRLSLLLLILTAFASAHSIGHYHAVPLRCEGRWALLRLFDLDGSTARLEVDTQTLHTRIAVGTPAETSPCEASSRYLRLLRRSSAAPHPLQNDGITHASQGLYLTTDLCPSSKKGYEERLYRSLIASFPHPVPVTLFVTTRWIERHQAAFDQLRRWDREGKLAILWGNHTAWHHYHPGVELAHNFVLSPKENLTADILQLERSLIERGVTPSVFFRFPGLVSDRQAVETVRRLGLIVVGSDAWLAKGQNPKEGSIILIHGNGNEPRGVDHFLKLLHHGMITKLQSLSDLKP